MADYAATASIQPFEKNALGGDLLRETRRGRWWFPVATWTAIAAAVLVTAFLLKASFFDDKNSIHEPELIDSTREIVVPQQTYVAYLVDEFDSQFENSKLDPSLGFQSGSYLLSRGSIHLRFRNGTDMILEAPARFEILDDMNFRLHDGRLRAMFPSSARGFRVRTPGVEYHDLRAEVGVYADSLEMRSDLHVFHGRVSSRIPGTIDSLNTFNARQAVVYRNGVLEKGVFDQSRFLKPGLIGFQRWQRLQSILRDYPDVIGFFPFMKTSHGMVPNHAQGRTQTDFDVMPDGKIGAATWVAGRWPQKRALMFEMEGDHVKLDIPGEYEELTYAVWMKLDRLDHSQNAILCSDGWQPGAVHWQLNRSGGPWMTSFALSSIADIKRYVPIGQWFHLVSTISTKTRTAQTFLNGELVSEVKMSDGVLLRPGSCRLGNWLNPAPRSERRTLKGRIDELVVMRRSLSQNEIRDLFDRGKPAAGWNRR